MATAILATRLLVIALALQGGATGKGSAQRPAGSDSAALLTQLGLETTRFLAEWRTAWELSETQRHPTGATIHGRWDSVGNDTPEEMLSRLRHLHCHPNGVGAFFVVGEMIAARNETLRAFCPQWLRSTTETFDERTWLDASIAGPLRAPVAASRAQLLDYFDDAASRFPGDAWIAGQRVRFALDQREVGAAERAVKECRAERWWCTALAGYLRYTAGSAAASDSVFTVMLAQMTPKQRCELEDLGPLLEPDGRRAYADIPCAQRDSVNRRIWWLADPLWTERGNERRAEHFARLVMAALRGSVEPSERWTWDEHQGGRLLREMLVRYGWPTMSWWFGPMEDLQHYGYLQISNTKIHALGVFTTQEYSAPRFHTVPDWAAVTDPWHAARSAWTLAAPVIPGKGADRTWWPQEHFARDAGALVQIPDEQTVILRRQNDLELTIASDLSPLDWGSGRPVSPVGTLIVSTQPDAFLSRAVPVVLDSIDVWRLPVAPTPAVVGVEIGGAQPGSPVARLRRGISPPPPLSALRAGEIAVSQPALLRPTPSGATPSSDPHVALGRMLGTTSLRGVTRVGVYWETYGVGPADTVEVAVRVERMARPGMFRRLATALHLASRIAGEVTVRWREPTPGVAATIFGDEVPIQGRNVTIDLSRLEPDHYSLTVSVSRPGGRPATAVREFDLLTPN